MIINLNEIPENQDILCDICIVGAGAAGTIIFDQLSKTNKNLVLLESGIENLEEEYNELNNSKVLLNGQLNEEVSDTLNWRVRCLGGTTSHWSGACSKLNFSDFEKRNWITNSGWPITLEDLKPYYKKANKYLEISSNLFDERVWKEIGINTFDFNSDKIESQFRHRSGYIKKTGYLDYDGAVNLKNVLIKNLNENKIFINATLTELVSSNNQNIDYGIIKTINGKKTKIISKHYVLCTGGWEVARILLNSGQPEGLGNNNGLVGRYYLGHIVGEDYANLLCKNKSIATKLFWDFNWHGIANNRTRAHLHFTEMFQKKKFLLNCGIWIDGTEDKNSAVYKAFQLKNKITNKKFSEIDLSSKNILKILKKLDDVLIAGTKGLFNKGVRMPMTEEIFLSYVGEQEPNYNSRIYLSEKKDKLGMKKMILDWHVSEKDKKNILDTTNYIAAIFGESEIGRIIINDDFKEKVMNFEGFTDAAHPSGTTRMSKDTKIGVVNTNLQSHFVQNLFICSSSVFPTSGYVSPTYTISALAIRLADYLKEK